MKQADWRRLVVFGCIAWGLFVGIRDVSAEESEPMRLARQSTEAMRTGDAAATARLVHPAELELFREFAMEAFQRDPKEKAIAALRAAFTKFKSAEEIKSAKGEEVLAAFLQYAIDQVPNYKELLADAKPQYLGEIVETPDRVYVVVRTLGPRPQPVGCIRDDGKWYTLLNDQTRRAIDMLKAIEKLPTSATEVVRTTRITNVEVIGHVLDGDAVAQVLCRTKAQVGEVATETLGLYPVRNGEAAWQKLDGDKPALAKALQEKWAKNELQNSLKLLSK